MDLQCQKQLFDLEDGIIYLNGAAYSPLMKEVVEEGKKSINLKARPYQIVPKTHFFDSVDEVRELLKIMINADDKDEIAMIPAVSYGLAIVAANLHRWPAIEKKKSILLIEHEFPNDFYAFQRSAEQLNLEIVTIPKSEDYNSAILSSLNEEVAMIVLPHVHWITGYLFDLETISLKCKDNGIMLVIDGTQSVGAFPFDVNKIKPDALIVATYKWLMGPYGQGFAYFSSFFHDGIPVEESWINRKSSENFAGLLNYESAYRPKAQRYNVGEYSQFIQIPMLKVALSQILKWGPDNIQKYCSKITEHSLKNLMDAGLHLASEKQRVNHLFSLQFKNQDEASKAYNFVSENRISVSLRGNCIRVSPYLYNTADEIETLFSLIQKNITLE